MCAGFKLTRTITATTYQQPEQHQQKTVIEETYTCVTPMKTDPFATTPVKQPKTFKTPTVFKEDVQRAPSGSRLLFPEAQIVLPMEFSSDFMAAMPQELEKSQERKVPGLFTLANQSPFSKSFANNAFMPSPSKL